MPRRTSRARATASSGPSICTRLPRAEMNTPSRFSIWTRLASNWPNSAASTPGSSNSISALARRGPSRRIAADVSARGGLRAISAFGALLSCEVVRPRPPRYAECLAAQGGGFVATVEFASGVLPVATISRAANWARLRSVRPRPGRRSRSRPRNGPIAATATCQAIGQCAGRSARSGPRSAGRRSPG